VVVDPLISSPLRHDANSLRESPTNHYDSRQFVEHLRQFPSEARSLIWTLNLEPIPMYAIEAVGPHAAEVNAILVDFLADA
jgi:hypothetical protein